MSESRSITMTEQSKQCDRALHAKEVRANEYCRYFSANLFPFMHGTAAPCEQASKAAIEQAEECIKLHRKL